MELIERLRNKDEVALRLLIDQYGDYLLRSAYLLVKDRQTAEEVVQDTFVTAYNKIDQLHDPASLRGWLTRIAVNRCRMKQRTWHWRKLFTSDHVEELLKEDDDPGPLDQLLISSRNESLLKAIHRLDYKYREVITLYYYNEMGVREIADQLTCNENTVKSRLARGRSMLRAQLIEGGEQHARHEVRSSTSR